MKRDRASTHSELGPRHFADPVLLEYQRRVLNDPADVRVVVKSRRIGISWAVAAAAALLAATARSAGGMDVFYIGTNKEMTSTFVRDAAFWAEVYDLAARDVEEDILKVGEESVTVYKVRFESGFTIYGLPSLDTSLRSRQGLVVLDEAAYAPGFEDVFDAATALLMWGGRIIVISSHNGADNPFAELVDDVMAGKLDYSLHKITLDDALKDGLYRRICQKRGLAWSPEAEASWREQLIAKYRTKEVADEELFCIPRRSAGAYLHRGLIEANMSRDIPVLRWAPPAPDFVDWRDDTRYREMRDFCDGQLLPLLARLNPHERHFLGEDFGRTQDLSIQWPVFERQNLTHHTPFVVELRDCPYRQQEQVLAYICDRLPRFSGAALDATGNGQAIAEYARQRYGSDLVQEVHLSGSFYGQHFPPFKAALEDNTLTLPADAEILDDFRAVQVVRGVPQIPSTRTKGSTGTRHGDAAVAALLAHYAARTIDGGSEWEAATASTPSANNVQKLLRGYNT